MERLEEWRGIDRVIGRELGMDAYPLGRGSGAVDAAVVFVGFGDFEEFAARFRVDLPHFRHFLMEGEGECEEEMEGWVMPCGGSRRSRSEGSGDFVIVAWPLS